MNWDDIAGHEQLKTLLKESISGNRISHAQLFTGAYGYGTLLLAIAFAKEILSRENPAAASKVDTFNHLDLHFTFPFFKQDKNSVSVPFQKDFRELIIQNPYANADDWSRILQSENKKLTIYAEEVDALTSKFSLKSFEGGSKILIVWQADRMNTDAANKFLKFLEEPPENTFIILTAEHTDAMLQTILSRTQIVEVPRIDDEALKSYLQKEHKISQDLLQSILIEAQGNANTAAQLARSEDPNTEFESYFIMWVREAFQVKKKPEFLKNIVLWARKIAGWKKETQLNFIRYCTEIFRLALLQNYGNTELVYKKISADGFKWDRFSQFISGANIEVILTELSEADYHLERNGNARIIWTDLGIKLSRNLHRN